VNAQASFGTVSRGAVSALHFLNNVLTNYVSVLRREQFVGDGTTTPEMFTNFRTASTSQSLILGREVSMSIPQTAVERLADQKSVSTVSTTVSINGNNPISSTSFTVTQYRSSLLVPTGKHFTILSNVLQISFTAANDPFLVTLATPNKFIPEPVTFFSRICNGVGIFNYTCVGSDHPVSINCNGRVGKFTAGCPVRRPTCGLVNMTGIPSTKSGKDICTVINVTDAFITCRCLSNMTEIGYSYHRRFNSTNQILYYNGVLNLIGMSEYTMEGVVIPSDSPSPSPSRNPSAVPSVLPSLSPTLSPTVLPSTSPSFIPTVIPTQKPSPKPTPSLLAVPTFVPTMVENPVILKFSANFSMSGLDVKLIADKTKEAIVLATAISMNLSVSEVTYVNAFQLPASSVNSFRFMLPSSAITLQAVVITRIVHEVKHRVSSPTTAADVYHALITKLQVFVSQGNFTKTLQSVSRQLGDNNLQQVTTNSVVAQVPLIETQAPVSAPTLTPPNNDSNAGLADSVIHGILFGVIAFLVVVIGVLVWMLRSRANSVAPAQEFVKDLVSPA
jgi:hypothetical protein